MTPSLGTCRRDGCSKPRRMRRGTLEPLCEDCYRQARQRVAEQLADEETAAAGRKRYRSFRLSPSQATSDRDAGQREPRAAQVGERQPQPEEERRRGSHGARLISEELLREARRLYALGLSLRAVAETLLDQTRYANAHSAEVALRSQFKRRGWALRIVARGEPLTGEARHAFEEAAGPVERSAPSEQES